VWCEGRIRVATTVDFSYLREKNVFNSHLTYRNNENKLIFNNMEYEYNMNARWQMERGKSFCRKLKLITNGLNELFVR
jgi:hypothetical protein